MNELAARFWQEFLEAHPEVDRAQPYDAWSFGDSAQMADELGLLVTQGIKKATASLLWEYEHEDSPLPRVGAYNIILDGQDRPLCVTQTVEVRVLPFDQVDAQFAYDEGEGDRTLAFWRDVHWRFFSRACADIGRTPTEQMPIVCERFRLFHPA